MKIRLMCCCLALCFLSCWLPFSFAEVAEQESVASAEPEPPPPDDAGGEQERGVVPLLSEPLGPRFPAVERFASRQQFEDVQDPDAYFYEAVYWAVGRGITNGTSKTKFSPKVTCTRIQIITFIWREKGRPESGDCPFTDMQDANEDFKKASAWAGRRGIEHGDDKGDTLKFEPDTKCRRGDAVIYLWKAFGSPKVSEEERDKVRAFTDILIDPKSTDPYTRELPEAVAWALAKEITKGTSDTTFSPREFCTRGQIVTFLYRAFLAMESK